MERQAFNSLNEAALQVQLEEGWSNPPGPTKEGNPRKRVVRDLKRKLGLPVSWHGGVGGDEPEYDPTGASRDLHKSRQDRKSKEAQSAKKKELTRKKLYPKSGLKGEKKTFADKLFNHVEYDEVDSMVLEYFENYFGDNLNEDTSDEDIMDAVYDLVELTEAVLEAVMGGWNTPIPNPLKPHDSVGGMRKGLRSDTWTAGQSMEKDRQAGRATRSKRRDNLGTKLMKSKKPPRYLGGKHDSHWSNR